MEQALDYVANQLAFGLASSFVFAQAAHLYRVNQQALEVAYDRQYAQWAAARGYDV